MLRGAHRQAHDERAATPRHAVRLDCLWGYGAVVGSEPTRWACSLTHTHIPTHIPTHSLTHSPRQTDRQTGRVAVDASLAPLIKAFLSVIAGHFIRRFFWPANCWWSLTSTLSQGRADRAPRLLLRVLYRTASPGHCLAIAWLLPGHWRAAPPLECRENLEN